MMRELKTKQLQSKIDRTLDSVLIYDVNQRKYLKKKIMALKEPIEQQKIDDRISLLNSKSIIWEYDLSKSYNEQLEKDFIDKLKAREKVHENQNVQL